MMAAAGGGSGGGSGGSAGGSGGLGGGSGGPGGSGGGTGGSASTSGPTELPAEYMLAFSDIKWDKDADDEKIELGRGAFGTVFAGQLHGQAVAIKHEVITHPGVAAAWTTTAVLHMRARCPHIAVMHGAAVRTPKAGRSEYYTVMERLAGNMSELLLTHGGAHHGADMALRLQLLADVADGLAYLHACSVIHGDVKPDNVLLTAVSPPRYPQPTAKLADFGSSVRRRVGVLTTHGTLAGERGTLLYMDPCLFDAAASITAASDVYSFGVLAWQVLTRLEPFDAEVAAAQPPTASGERVRDALRLYVRGGGRPPVVALVEAGVPSGVVTLVQSCWAPEPGRRPAMSEVKRVMEAAAAAAVAVAAGTGTGAAGGPGIGGGDGRAPTPAPAPLPAPAPPAAPPAAPVAAPLPLAAAPLPVAGPAPAPVHAPAIAAPSVVSAPLDYEWDDNLVLRGHTKTVCSLALLQGDRLAGGDEGGIVRLWDTVHGGEASAVLDGHGGEVRALAVLPDGRRMAAGVSNGRGEVGAIVVWDTSVVPPTICAAIDCGSGVHALAVLRDGRLAAGCYNGGVLLVEVAADAGAVAATLKGHTLGVLTLVVLPDGTLASGSHDKTVRLWDVEATTCVATLAGHTSSVWALAVLADGRLASGSIDCTVRLWNVGTRACVGILKGHNGSVHALAVLPDGRLASGSWDGTIRVWDTRPAAGAAAVAIAAAAAAAAAGRSAPFATPAVAVLEGHTRTVYALALLPGGRLASGSDDRTVRLWRLPPP